VTFGIRPARTWSTLFVHEQLEPRRFLAADASHHPASLLPVLPPQIPVSVTIVPPVSFGGESVAGASPLLSIGGIGGRRLPVAATAAPAAQTNAVSAFDGMYQGSVTITIHSVVTVGGKTVFNKDQTATNAITLKVVNGSVTIPTITGGQQSGSVSPEGVVNLKLSYSETNFGTVLKGFWEYSGRLSLTDGKVSLVDGRTTNSLQGVGGSPPFQSKVTVTGSGRWQVSGEQLAFGGKVSEAFRAKLLAVAKRLGINPNFLMAVMAFESNIDPKATNKSGATGLIQFTETTAKALGTTTEKLRGMTAEQQLDYVEKYFSMVMKQRGSSLSTLEDVYMAVLQPSAVGKPNSAVLFRKGSKEYDGNSGLDANKDGSVTKDEASARVRGKLAEGMKPGNSAVTSQPSSSR